ncbi:MAG: proline/glycine betaine ABC transporter permease [Rhizobiaceae bacterium]
MPAKSLDFDSVDNADTLIAEFCGISSKYYIREFRRLDDEARFRFSFNWAASIFGSSWYGIRGLWAYFWVALVLELATLTQICKGWFGSLGAEELARAESIAQIAAVRTKQAAEAAAAGAENADRLAAAAHSLQDNAEKAYVAAEKIAAGGAYYLFGGLIILLLIKIVIGFSANWSLERQYMKWRADKTVTSRISSLNVIAVVSLVSVVYGVTIINISRLTGVSYLEVFPFSRPLNVNTSRFLDHLFDNIAVYGSSFFGGITAGLRYLIDGVDTLLVGTPWPVVMALVLLAAYRSSGPRVAIFTAAALAYLGLFGFWEKAMVTVSLLGTAAFLCVLFGVPLGIWCGKNKRVYVTVRPVLDLMQTMPAFVYLIPVIAFFGIGRPPGVVATIIFGLPPVVRLTALGIQGVPASIKEAAVAFGASRWFVMTKVELPLAMPSIMAGINQTILMCLSMVVIASLIGAKGLGEDVLVALQFAAKGQGVLAGLAILFCAMILDRLVQGKSTHN